MPGQTTDAKPAASQRSTAHIIHYDISYVVQGVEHGPDGAIVLLHDILGGAFVWENVMPALAGLNRAVYAVDMLGYGQSEHPWPADTSVWGHADCMNFLLEKLNLTNVVLVGQGLGGGVAQILATRLSPRRVAALVLIDSICYENTFAPDWPLPDMQKRQDQNAPMQTKLEDMMHDLRETVPNGAYHSDKLKGDELNPYLAPWDSHLGKEVLFQHIRLLLSNYSNSVSSDLKTMGKPTLIIWGEKDTQIPLKFAQRLHREIPESRLVIIPEAGHMILLDASQQVADALSDFIGRL